MITLSKSGLILKDGKKVSPVKASPLFCGQGILSESEMDEARKLINRDWGMVNQVNNRFGYDKPHCKK